MPQSQRKAGYLISRLKLADPNRRLMDTNPVVPNVRKAFSRIESSPNFMAALTNGHFPGRCYGSNMKDNHFQGAQRLHHGNYLVISGGDINNKMSHLFVVEMGSRRAAGSWGSNLIHRETPPSSDRVVTTVALGRKLWHAGGLSLSGDILVVPIEDFDSKSSRIIFLDVQHPPEPRQFPFFIERQGSRAGAVALTRLQNGLFVCAVWSDADDQPRRLDFYLSVSTNFRDGFRAHAAATWQDSRKKTAPGLKADSRKYQAISFITQQDGRLFLIGTLNTSPPIKVLHMRPHNIAELFTVKFPASNASGGFCLQEPVITKIAEREFDCEDPRDELRDLCDLNAGVGIFVEPSGRLSFYATPYWRRKKLLRFAEFPARVPKNSNPITFLDDAWIDLYEKATFEGQRLSICGPQDARIENYHNIKVQGKQFDDKVRSVRFQIPRGFTYRLCQNNTWGGRFIDLVGTGKVDEIENLELHNFKKKTSSSRFFDPDGNPV